MIFPSDRGGHFSPGRFSLLLGVALAVFYWRVLFGGETFYYRDFGVLAIPTATFQKETLLSGEFPFWNPYSNCGAPFFAQWGTMVLYPLSLIYVLLPLPWSLNFFCIVHLWIGGMGIYFLARRWCGDDRPAAVAGVAFTFNGISQAALAWPNYVAAIALAPWVLLATEKLWVHDGRKGKITVAALVGAAQMLTGVPELTVLTWIVVMALWALHLRAEPKQFGRHLFLFGALALSAIGLAAVQLLPFYELLQHSQRAPGFAAEKWALPRWGWANFILPRFHTFTTPEGTVFQYNQAFLSSTYVGSILIGLGLCSTLRPNPRIWALVVVAALGALLALGSEGILYSHLISLFPSISVARYPVKFLFLVGLVMPLLAAFGMQSFERLSPRSRFKVALSCALIGTAVIATLVATNHSRPMSFDRLEEFRDNSLARWSFAILGLGIAVAAARWKERSNVFRFAFLILLLVDWKSHLPRLNPTTDSSIFQGNFWGSAGLDEQPRHGKGRVFITAQAEERLLHGAVADARKDITTKRLAEWSHLNLLDRIPKVNGSSTLQVREQAWLQSSLYSGTNQHRADWLDFLAVTHELSTNSLEWTRRSTALPFVTAGQSPLWESSDLIANPIDFRTNATLHSNLYHDEIPVGATVAITNVLITANEVRFEADASSEALAVVAQTWFPAWRVEVKQGDSVLRNVPVLKVNVAFQGAVLPAGRSSVRFYFHDHSFWIGFAISGATLLALIVLDVRSGRTLKDPLLGPPLGSAG